MEDKDYKYIDYLDEDDPIPHQNFACISFLSPEGVTNCSLRGLKIRGIYNTKEEADARAKQLSELDPDFDIHVGEVGKWLPWDPSPDTAENQIYSETDLNEIMRLRKKSLHDAKKVEADRKSDLMKQSVYEEKARRKLHKEQNKKKLELSDKERKQMLDNVNDKLGQMDMDELLNMSNTQKKKVEREHRNELARKERLDKETTLVKDKKQHLDQEVKDVSDRQHNLENIDDQLNEIKKLYENLQKKEDNITL